MCKLAKAVTAGEEITSLSDLMIVRAVDGWRDGLVNLGRPSSLGCSFCFFSQITSSTYKNDDSKTVNAFPQLLQLLRDSSYTSQARHFA